MSSPAPMIKRMSSKRVSQRRTTAWARRIAWLLLLPIGAAKCPGSASNAVSEANKAATPPDSAEQLLFGARLNLNAAGVGHGVLTAKKAWVYEDGTRVELEGVNVTFQNATGVNDGVLTADRGTYRMSGARVEVFGHVVASGKDGRKLQTPRLTLDLAKNQLRGDSAYTFTEVNPSRTSSGTGVVADPQLNKVMRAADVPPAKKPAATRAPSK